MKPKAALAFAVAFAAAFRVFAFLAPVESRDGVTIRIAWFEEEKTGDRSLKLREVEAGEPLEISVAVSNMGERRVKGTLSVWLNDDWIVDGDLEESVSIEPGEQRIFRRKAVPTQSLLDAIYPVHAELRTKAFTLHPIALFRAKPPDAWLAGTHAKMIIVEDPPVAEDDAFIADVEFGTNGLLDATITIGDGMRRLTFSGFECEVDGQRVAKADSFTVAEEEGRVTVDHVCGFGRKLRAEMWSEGGSLRIAWSMPEVERSSLGTPRYTRLAIGNCSHPAMRAYAGLGNVVEDPVSFSLATDGFRLSTRHVGADYANGMSLVQAVDVFPEGLECDSAKGRYSLVSSHDATFTFVPSMKGAFAAARRFAAISGYAAAPGVAKLRGKMCLDQWGGDLATAGSNVLAAAKYGLSDAIYVRHMWQRWGYDYRLPDICPAADHNGFLALRRDSAKAGIEFCPHDNYIDFYPDADGFSYDDIVFGEDGKPVKAWYNSGAKAQSYLWLPHAFVQRLDRNVSEMRRLYTPDALFIDVFTAKPPFDYRDRSGCFYPKTVTQEEWGKAFDLARKCLGRSDAAMLGEAGTDVLIGHVDGTQSDHFPASRWFGREGVFSDSERVPWHDMVTHGKMVLFAGGLGHRYAAVDWNTPGDETLHGYGSDDYLANTVIGGRSPMCDGPFNRRAVMTYWLLHDVCERLAGSEFEKFGFDGNNIHRLHSTFGAGEVWANRATNSTWSVAGATLPPYGFVAKCGDAEAGVVETHGRRWAYSKGPSGVFVDARGSGVHSIFGIRTDGAVRITADRPGFMKRHTPFIGSNGEILVTPLPGSGMFDVTIDPTAFGFPFGHVKDVVAVDQGEGAADVRWTQKNGVIAIRADGNAFAYKILFR